MKKLITRADDFGSAAAANEAIFLAVEKGRYIKNVSCLAVGPAIRAGAGRLEELRKKKEICIGLHAALNSEWENVFFKSILPPEKIPSLVNEKGVFAMHPMMFAEKMPDIGEALKEISAQLDFLTSLGLTVEYMDSHMLPEAAVPGLMDAFSDFAKRKGLVDQRGYYTFAGSHQPELSGEISLEEEARAYRQWLLKLEEGRQYINILHPAIYSEETRQFYNRALTGDTVAKSREAENRLLQSGLLERYCGELEICPITYLEAEYQGDTTMDALKNF